MNEERKSAPEGDALQDLSQIFAPSWARQSPEEVAKRAARSARADADTGDGPRPRTAERGILRSPRPPLRGAERERGGDGRRPARREGGFGGPRGGGRNERGGDSRPPRTFAPRTEPPRPLPPLDVRFLPEQKALGAIIRRIQTTRRAYPVRDIVRLFQKSDEGLLVRIEGQKGSGEPAALFQCRVCGMPAMSDAEVREHLLRRHLEDFYDVDEVESEAPGGHFSCVARCGLSGELLGPPNHHSFGLRVQEILRERYPEMAEEEYRARIEMVRDPEVVEAWRAANRLHKRYRRKAAPPAPPAVAADSGEDSAAPGAEDEAKATAQAPEASAAPAESAPPSPGVERHVAELQFGREIVPQQIGSAPHLVCPATVLKNMLNRRLAALLNERFDEETRRNGSLFHAIHGAFRHRGLHLFRAVDERGPEFVMASKPVPIETTHIVARLRQIIAFVGEHPCCLQTALIEALEPSGDTAACAELATQVQWLVEKGHLVAYFNGMLALPSEHPAFRPHAPSARPKGTAARKGAAGEAESEGVQPSPQDAPDEAPAGEPDAPVASAAAEAGQDAALPETPPETPPGAVGAPAAATDTEEAAPSENTRPAAAAADTLEKETP